MIRLIYENRIISDDGSGRDRAGIVPEPKGKRKTLRQKDQIPYETLESDDAPTKPNLSGYETERTDNIPLSARFSFYI